MIDEFELDDERNADKKRQHEMDVAQSAEDLRSVASTVAGRAFLWDLFTMCGLYAVDIRGESTHAMARATGKRAIALEIVENLFTADPHSYTLIRDQAMARRAARENR